MRKDSISTSMVGLLGLADLGGTPFPKTAAGGSVMALKLTSTAFGEGSLIPRRYTCDGENISPPLAWTGVPAGARSLALIVDDPDAPVGT